MKFHVLRELQPYSLIELQNMFNLGEDDLKSILKTFSLMNISKRLSKDLSKIELEVLLDTDNIDDFNNQIEGNMYVFKYVGIIMIKNLCLVIYPKYSKKYLHDKENDYKILKQLISVIRKYKSKEQKFGISDNNDIENYNLLSIALDLIFNYYEHGLYSNEKEIVEYNGEGEILWEKTINENTAYFTGKFPIYLDTFRLNHENNENDYFRRLHAAIITTICDELNEILKIIDIEPIEISSENLDNFGNKEYILYRLNQELSTQFITYKQDILNLLRKYIEEDSNTLSSERISFVGTNSFNLIWEDVCSVVMEDCLNKSIKELGFTYSKISKQSALLSDIIPKPKWIYDESKTLHTALKTLIPDIITINKEDKLLSIYDAKYYDIKLDDKELKNQPGVGDITKQYLYELSYKDFAKENNLKININAFLMPTEDKEERIIGYASMELFHALGGIELNDIKVILKPTEDMYEEYLES